MNTVLRGVPTKRIVEACDEAEDRFRDCATQITTEKPQGQSRINIYHDANQVPVAIGKSSVAKSVLTLQPIVLASSETSPLAMPDSERLVYPGSIGALGSDTALKRTGHSMIKGWFLNSLLVEGSVSLCPFRLSQWAHEDAAPNSSYAMSEYQPTRASYDDEGNAMFADLALNDFRVIANQALVICGVREHGPEELITP